MNNPTWYDRIAHTMSRNGETWEDVQRFASDAPLQNTYPSLEYGGGGDVVAFTVWTADYVYFPAEYDGIQWCDCVPRNPTVLPQVTYPIGG